MTYGVTQNHERDRLNALADSLEADNARLKSICDKYRLYRDPEWLDDIAKGFNRYPWTDERNEPTAREIERRRVKNG